MEVEEGRRLRQWVVEGNCVVEAQVVGVVLQTTVAATNAGGEYKDPRRLDRKMS